jgi:extracellular elastinolytic metalloproteinase
MARKSLFTRLALLTAVLVSGPVHAQQAGPFEIPPARVARGSAGQPLAASPGADPAELVRTYLRNSGHSAATVSSVVLSSRDTVARTGVTHLRFTQRVGTFDVYGTYLKASVDTHGNLISVVENLAPAREIGGGPLAGGEGRALAIGLQQVHGDQVPPGFVRRQGNTSIFARTAFFHRGPTVTQVAIPMGAAGLRLGYLVETWSERANELHHTLVGGDGAVLGVEARTAHDTYSVFLKNPGVSRQTTEIGPASGGPLSPAGWLSTSAQTTTSISGNNVHAYLDIDADNDVDVGGTAVTNGNFTAVWDGTTQPSTASNREVATQNLFYLNNVTHDRLYSHGFTESAANFQEDNFGKGGLDSDAVLAEVQDGSGVDNANFATPADGSNPRMQMYVWLGLGNSEVVVGTDRYTAQLGGFSPALTVAVTGALAVANDGAGKTSDACDRFPRNALAGQIAIVDRGTCDFTVKVSNAHRAGAIAVVVANNAATAIFSMGGSGTSKIPAVMVSQADGETLKGLAGQNGSVQDAETDPLNRDSSLDSDIVYHEYGHGLTWRMIGNMSGAMSGAIGEGMSDVLALLFNDDNDVIGEYSAFDDAGIRSEPYRDYSRTYADVAGTGVHFDGEVYAAIGWRMRKNFAGNGESAGTLLDYIVDGMNYTPSSPKFEDMRDGILAAIGAGNPAHQCLVWDAFAHFGVGVGAKGTVRGKRIVVTPSTTLPASCSAIP